MFSRCVVSQVKHNSYFLVGLALGLWLALVAVPLDEAPVACPASEAPAPDDFEPHREARPLGAAGPAAGRSVQRPRYYTTELGMRGSLMSGVLSSEDVLSTRTAALNATASGLQPLRVFVAAAAGAAPPRPNVVGFTDSREMLKPFHALKYLADNFLDEYDFFFLVSDTSFVNARRLKDLVSKLSVSQDVYMGTVAEDDSHYCTLEGGIVVSSSVLRAVHGELDWCVRNSYSAHHHENIGRCVLHAAHRRCQPAAQGETYTSIQVTDELALPPSLAEAVTAHPVHSPDHFYRLHAFVSRLYLQRDVDEVGALRAQLAGLKSRHPKGYRNYTWPAGLRADPGLAPPTPDNRFDHLRWTLFNASHALMPDDHHAAAPLAPPTLQAVQLVMDEARAWALRRWGGAGAGAEVRLIEGAWRWEPAHALRYRLLLRLQDARGDQMVKLVEVARPLGAARLVPAPYVTESARVTLVVALRTAADLADMQRRAPHAQRDGNVAPTMVIVRDSSMNDTFVSWMRSELSALFPPPAGLILETTLPPGVQDSLDELQLADRVQREAVKAALAKAPRDALIVLVPPHADYNQEFLNRARMNSIVGSQWFWALGFARYSVAALPAWAAGRPHHHTGRFAPALTQALAFYRADLEAALSSWAHGWAGGVADVLAAAPLRCIRAPDPALVLAPRPAPCRAPPHTGSYPALAGSCVRAHRADGFRRLQLGDKHALAKLLLEQQAAAAAA